MRTLNEHNKPWQENQPQVPLYGVNMGSETIKCPGQIETRHAERVGRGELAAFLVEDVDEAAIFPSKCNKRKGGQ